MSMRNFHATQRHCIAFFEHMKIYALTHAHVRQVREAMGGMLAIGFQNVMAGCQFAILLFTRNDLHPHTSIFGNRSIICKRHLAIGQSLSMGSHYFVEVKALRRLHKPEGCAIHRALDQTARRIFHCIRNWQTGNHSYRVIKFTDHIADQIG